MKSIVESKFLKLIKNTGIFAVTNMMSKIAALIIVPVFSFYLSTSEYGIIDTVITTVGLLMPLLSLSINEAVIRFGMIQEVDTKKVLSNAIVIIAGGLFLYVISIPFTLRYLDIRKYILVTGLILILNITDSIFAAYLKAVDRIKLCSLLSVLQTCTFLIFSIISIVKLHNGIFGYLYSMVISYAINVLLFVYIIFKPENFRLQKPDVRLLKKMVIYSTPLMVNGLMWWIMMSLDKYFIIYFLGQSSNGIYSVSNKIPGIISLVHTTFFSAWQLSAIEEYSSKDKSGFYSSVFEKYSGIAFSASFVTITVVRPFITIFFAEEYRIAWRYSLFLILATMIYSFSSFYGAMYTASKNTVNALTSSTMGAVTNLILNLELIPRFGIQGAAAATFLSYTVMWLIRLYDTRKYARISFNKIKFGVNSLIATAQIGVMLSEYQYSFIITVLLCICGLIININDLILTFLKFRARGKQL